MKRDGDGAGVGDAVEADSTWLDELTVDELIDLTDRFPDGKLSKTIRDTFSIKRFSLDVPEFKGSTFGGLGPAVAGIYTGLHCEKVAESVADSAVASVPTAVQPEGGQWPHKKGEPWTDVERDAMFLMRHRDKMPDADLAKIVGAKRQMINDLIGPKRLAGKLADIQAKSKGWKPSAGLLEQCNAALQPLQSAAAILAA